jgi:hypothetical protein
VVERDVDRLSESGASRVHELYLQASGRHARSFADVGNAE